MVYASGAAFERGGNGGSGWAEGVEIGHTQGPGIEKGEGMKKKQVVYRLMRGAQALGLSRRFRNWNSQREGAELLARSIGEDSYSRWFVGGFKLVLRRVKE